MTGRASTSRAAKPWLDDGDVQLYHGDVCDVLRSLPAGAAQTCVTSPPYWGLRDYGAAGQIGLEDTPELYVERMVAVFREVWRVLREDGTLWLNLGDSYASAGATGHGGWDGNNKNPDGSPRQNRQAGDVWARSATAVGGLKPKDLVGIPWRVAFALQDDGWYLRSDVVWSKPNPMPESVTDRPTKAHEYVFLLAKRPRYFYDADAVRERYEPSTIARNAYHRQAATSTNGGASHLSSKAGGEPVMIEANPSGRNLRSVWEVATEPFPEAHFATYPQALVRRCILAGTSERGECAECGAPWRRQVDRESVPTRTGLTDKSEDIEASFRSFGTRGGGNGNLRYRTEQRVETTGWEPSCSCLLYDPQHPDGPNQDGFPFPTEPQIVLDPFIGSATTALVARKHGRRCIGIDLSAEYLDIAARRLQQLSLFADPATRSRVPDACGDPECEALCEPSGDGYSRCAGCLEAS